MQGFCLGVSSGFRTSVGRKAKEAARNLPPMQAGFGTQPSMDVSLIVGFTIDLSVHLYVKVISYGDM